MGMVISRKHRIIKAVDKFDWTKDCDGIEVTCHGYEEGIANFLEWENEGCSYDVWCMSTGEGNLGMSDDEVYAMVTSIK